MWKTSQAAEPSDLEAVVEASDFAGVFVAPEPSALVAVLVVPSVEDESEELDDGESEDELLEPFAEPPPERLRESLRESLR